MGLDLFSNLQKSSLQVNGPLLKLKFTYFFVYAIWFIAFPYVSLISTQIIDYTQLAIIYGCVPATSILGPVITGFVADKIGNYKMILTATLLLNAVMYLSVLWLGSDHLSYNAGGFNQTNSSANNSDLVSTSSSVPQSTYTFPLLLVVRLVAFYTFDTTNFLLDSCSSTMCKKYGGDFGRQKMFSMASMIIFPVIVGVLIDKISAYRGFNDYSMAFYISTAITLGVTVLIFNLDVQVEKNKHSFVQTAKEIIRMIDVDAFFLVQVVVGICSGWHRSFFPVYVNLEIEDSKIIFGAAASISGIGSIIVYWTAKKIVEKFGAPTTVAVSLILTCLRFSAYYFFKNPWVILINESLEGTSGFLSVVAGNYFCGVAAPPGMVASLNGLLSAAVFGAGRGMGLTLGSVLTAEYGIRFTYLVFGIFAGVTSLSYIIVYHLFLKKIEQARLLAANQKPNETAVENTASVACAKDSAGNLSN
ncbi:uncharacterized protein LOC124191923 [Daphnia pulex]|uniref:uncharacterized protein LOC124191923 n=1 Tax=Daphnia pulex TaxID=6669 RepID=UPI001EDE727C|nr:uncharacterized protein LOC124191923 [Daphnia pulex]